MPFALTRLTCLLLACVACPSWANGYFTNSSTLSAVVFPFMPTARINAANVTDLGNNPALLSNLESAQYSGALGYTHTATDLNNSFASTGGSAGSAGVPVSGSADGDMMADQLNPSVLVALPKVAYLGYTDLNVAVGLYRRFNWDVAYENTFKGQRLADSAKAFTDTAELNLAFPVNASKTLRVGGGIAVNRTSATFNTYLDPAVGKYRIQGRDNQTRSHQYGITYTPSALWQFAASAHSKVKVEIDGTLTAQSAASNPVAAVGTTAAVPAFAALSFTAPTAISYTTPSYRQIGLRYQPLPSVAVSLGWQHNNWTTSDTVAFDSELTAATIRAAITAQNGGQTPAEINTQANKVNSRFVSPKAIDLRYKNTDAFAVGIEHVRSDKLTVAGSFAYDPSPVTGDQSLYLPATDKYTMALAAMYSYSPTLVVSAATQLTIAPTTGLTANQDGNQFYADLQQQQFSALLSFVKRF